MVIIMPAFAHCKYADNPVVLTIVASLIIAISKKVGQGIDRPGDVPINYGSDQDAPDEKAISHLKST